MRILSSLTLVLISFSIFASSATGELSYINNVKEANSFILAEKGFVPNIYFSSEDFPGVIKAANSLQNDIQMVTNQKPQLISQLDKKQKFLIIIGTVGKSQIIDNLLEKRKINAQDIKGRWENYIIKVVENPFPQVEKALVIAGSDKRGTIYGIYDLSAHIGVSPWYWWADVPVKKQENIYVKKGIYASGTPEVKYRGIFINDEAPALSGWVWEKFGGFNHHFYEKVFELILRMRGNYLWPAMWGNAFNDDDKLNPKIADEYGIVVGTSHHEPLMRAHDEWRRYGKGKWNYQVNDSVLRWFWTEGLNRVKDYEKIVTVGMRGDGDEPMSEESNIALLEKIVSDQREIIKKVSAKDPSETPQIWALYKEVQDYYDKGMRVPDDITLLLCDDNWGNIRKLPTPGEEERKGGYGIYYHFDYVGGPRNYKWLNTNPIQKTWEQMHLAYQYKARQIWIVNVGDIKPMEFPIEFFLDYAWNPKKWDASDLETYTQLWAAQQFGPKYAKEIAKLIDGYTKFNGRRKPEMLSPQTYSLANYNEAEQIVNEYNLLAQEAERIEKLLGPEYKSAYYQLVLYPVKACATVNEMYVSAAKNKLYAKQNRISANNWGEKVKELFGLDSLLFKRYHSLDNGKWNHMMSQTHIGYTYWQQPEKQVMPKTDSLIISDKQELGIAIEGSEKDWTIQNEAPVLPSFDKYNKQVRSIELFNKGGQQATFSIISNVPFIHTDNNQGTIETDQKINFSVDWEKAPTGNTKSELKILANGKEYKLICNIINPEDTIKSGFIENDRCIAMEAVHFTNKSESGSIFWKTLPNHGRTLSAITPFPVTSVAQVPGNQNSPFLEYEFNVFDTASATVYFYMSPSLHFIENKGLRFAYSIDNENPEILDIHSNRSLKAWENNVGNSINITSSSFKLQKKGLHRLKFWMVDPGVVLQKIVIDLGGMKNTYLGPPESLKL